MNKIKFKFSKISFIRETGEELGVEFENVKRDKCCNTLVLSYNELGECNIDVKIIYLSNSIIKIIENSRIQNYINSKTKLKKEYINGKEIEVEKKHCYIFKEMGENKYKCIIIELKTYQLYNYLDFRNVILFNKDLRLVEKQYKYLPEISVKLINKQYSIKEKAFKILIEIDHNKNNTLVFMTNIFTNELKIFNELPTLEKIFGEEFYKTCNDLTEDIKKERVTYSTKKELKEFFDKYEFDYLIN